MDWRDYLTDTARAVSFLSRITVPASIFVGHDGNLSRAVRAFPLAGALIALPSAAALCLMLVFHASPLLAAFAALGVQAVVTGALHEDGLSDAADGLGGGRDRDHALAIMKDSRIGSYGAVALVLTFGLRAAAIAEIATHIAPLSAALCLPATAALSRALMVWHWSSLPPARTNGVAAGAGAPLRSSLNSTLITGAALAAILLIPVASLFAYFLAILAAALAVAAFTARVRRAIAGHTGDTIGATQQVAEIASLVALAMAS
ncbi:MULTISPECIES: adenosylcobinamide-GDP ribazoletransferase [Alphaproteobacteria]|uniref:Adenosylcobinamide-GDP ribazoletransferase n=2 Tax=Alphaproteobacteria TaxID=28211 RepID=A0A512HCA7_9HYPH|nr:MULTISPECIES: adenosylcobinamide-GDP ribazoletransferase [Alphaproteobacteria]GEO83086.1 adenosylcobinamide-GDP ribazoletransferase [Ciceribacter naphthalenivorans]GLR20519.1 adenosylcobinamide-GDP ribazoletransferase [Ciceribacter naphthalenivorans]GLT03375.1 adenosylcobinamide-GDP ribazoletransferase [Sphingomonas psychrolutea]